MKTSTTTAQSVNPHEYADFIAAMRAKGFAVVVTGVDTFSAIGIKIDFKYNRNQQVISAVSSYADCMPDKLDEFLDELILETLDKPSATGVVQSTPVQTIRDRHGNVIPTKKPVSPLTPATVGTLKAVQGAATTPAKLAPDTLAAIKAAHAEVAANATQTSAKPATAPPTIVPPPVVPTPKAV
jgi:hypothetical protein